MKTKTKSIIVLMIALFTILTIGSTKVNAVEITEEGDPNGKFCMFTIQGTKGYIDNMGQGSEVYQELGCMIKDITDGYYLQLNTEINLGTKVNLKGLGDFTLVRNYNDDDGHKFYEYKTEIKDVNKIEKKVQTFEYALKDIDKDLTQHFTLILSFMGEIEKTYTVNDKATGMGISLNGTTEIGVSLKADTIKEDNQTYIKMKNMLGVSNGLLQISAYDISLTGGNYKGDLEITFDLGTQFNNKKVIIIHQKKDNTTETFEEKVVAGKVKIKVSELSPFMIAVQDTADNTTNNNNQTEPTKPETTKPTPNNEKEKDKTPKTGIMDIAPYIMAVTIMSAVGIIAVRKKQTK